MKNSYPKGFTLIEILVAMSIFTLIGIYGSRFIATGFRTFTFGSEQQTAIENARRAMEIMTKEIRGANDSERGDYPLTSTEDDNFVFYSDIDYNGETEKVRYFLDGLTFYRVITPAGPANDYNQPGATTTIARYISNQGATVFSYFDKNLVETDDLDQIRLIRIYLMVNVTPERAPDDYILESDVHLRNLKDNL